jgi:putative PIN family toxin of toxin-antitoxin system
MKLVLDTNVVMELLHWGDPRSAALLAMIEHDRVQCLTDADCLAELRRVLAYPQFARDEAAQIALFERYAAITTSIAPGGIDCDLPRCRDRDDQKFLELAARAGADLLVTRDRELLRLAHSRRHPAPFGIVTPEIAITRLQEAA